MEPLKDCIKCNGHGYYMEPRGEYWGIPCSEPVLCECVDRADLPDIEPDEPILL